jgi:hypothetical protein
MSEQYPECPLYNHNNCKEFYNPKLCAIAKRDKTCLKKKGNPKNKPKAKDGNEVEELIVPDGIIGKL